MDQLHAGGTAARWFYGVSFAPMKNPIACEGAVGYIPEHCDYRTAPPSAGVAAKYASYGGQGPGIYCAAIPAC